MQPTCLLRSLFAFSLLAVACSANDGQPRESIGTVEQASTSVCPSATLEGIDVSAGQGTIDWASVKASGRVFAFIKATQGDYNTSASWAAQWSGAATAGLLRGPLHFFDPTIDGVAQAQHFLSVVGSLGPGDLPPVLDLECPTSSTQSSAAANCEYTGNSGWVSAATLNQRVHDWLDYVSAQTGRVPIIYSYNAWFQDSGMDSTTLSGTYPLFIAFQTSAACFTVGMGNAFTSAAFWQWSNSGSCPGVTGPVDLDRFVGTLADLRHLAGLDVDAGADGGASASDASAGEAGGGEAGASESGGGDGSASDAGVPEGGGLDAGSGDAGGSDASAGDADAGGASTNGADASSGDAGNEDATEVDAGGDVISPVEGAASPEAGAAADAPEAADAPSSTGGGDGAGGSVEDGPGGAKSGSSSGCGCALAGEPEGEPWALVGAAMLVAGILGRRTKRSGNDGAHPRLRGSIQEVILVTCRSARSPR